MVDNLIFIPHNTPSLKNSKIKTSRGIFASKTVKKYLGLLGIQSYSSSRKIVVGYKLRPNIIEELRHLFEEQLKDKEPPYHVGFHFIRNSRRSCDFNNVNQIIADLLVAHDIIKDDDMDNFLPYPLMIENKAYSIDKVNPGVLIKIN